MATTEFQARALFDFFAEGPSELNLRSGEIITITSGTNGNDWWYAQNSAGQFGAVPATYVEIISNESNPVQPPPPPTVASETNDDNSDSRRTSATNYQPRLEEERQDSINGIRIEQSNHSTDHDGVTDSSFDSLSSPITSENLLSSNSLDPLEIKNETFYPMSSSGQVENQLNSLLGDLTFSTPVAKSDYVYDTPTSSLIPVTSSETTSTNDLMTDNSSIHTTKSNDENLATKTKPEKTKLFSLKRAKSKSDLDRRRTSTDNNIDSGTIGSKDDSDSDCSGSPHNTLSGSYKQSSTSGDSKTLARAKFFDKHGVGNYLLNECKTKPDEHVEIVYDENDGAVYWAANPDKPPFTCKLENPSKETKLAGLKTFVAYKIHPDIPGSRVVGRRYKQFDWLHEQLVNKYRFICIPPLPGKQIAGRFEQEFVEDRRRQLELWLNRICHHPVLCASFPVQHFITCELTEKDNKDWKAGKRKVEKDEFREATWLHCVTFPESKLSDIEIASQIDIFAQQQPSLETHLKNLNQGFAKYLDRHTEIYERDMQRVGELFIKLHTVVHADATTTGNDDLSNSMSKISNSYNVIAELFRTKGYEGIRDFLERIQEFLGLLISFPMILNIHRSATDFIRNAQTRGPTATPDLNATLHRNQALNHVVLAEINYFQKEKVQDLKVYLKSLLDEQIEFYEKITSELRDALSTFN